MTFPSRSREARREEYLRNREARLAHYRRSKDTERYARRVLAQETGTISAMIPDELAEAKLAHLRALRALKEALPPVLVADYLAGATSYDLAEKYGVDRGRVTATLKAYGITMKRRHRCKHGHAFTAANTAFTAQGWRRCRKCACERTKRSHAKRLASGR